MPDQPPTVVVVTTPAIEPGPEETAPSAASESEPQRIDPAAAVAAAAQQAVEIGSDLGQLQAQLTGLSADVGALRGAVESGTSRMLEALQAIQELLTEDEAPNVETNGAERVAVESPAPSTPTPTSTPAPVRPRNRLRQLLLGA